MSLSKGKEIIVGAKKASQQVQVHSKTLDHIVELNEKYSTPMAKQASSSYLDVRSNSILEALKVDGYDKLMPPTQVELEYVSNVYENKGYWDINSITSAIVDSVGRTELENLNNQLKDFTSKMNSVDSTGSYNLIDELSVAYDSAELPQVWEKAKNAKPTLLARILGIFNPHAVKKSVLNRYDAMARVVQDRGASLEAKFVEIEKGLKDRCNVLVKNIDMLDKSSLMYYNAFCKLRTQFIMIRYMEYNYELQLKMYKEQNEGTQDIVVQNQIKNYERIARELTTRRMLIHKVLLQLPMTDEQSRRLVNVSRSLIDEINNTLLASMPVIRMNFVGIKAALDAERAFLSNSDARNLEQKSGQLIAEVSGNLAVRSELAYGANRLAEANAIDQIANTMLSCRNSLVEAKNKSKKDIDEATNLLHNTTIKVQQVMSTN